MTVQDTMLELREDASMRLSQLEFALEFEAFVKDVEVLDGTVGWLEVGVDGLYRVW